MIIIRQVPILSLIIPVTLWFILTLSEIIIRHYDLREEKYFSIQLGGFRTTTQSLKSLYFQKGHLVYGNNLENYKQSRIEKYVINLETFGPFVTNQSRVIVVQLNRSPLLRYTLHSLRYVQGIEDCLIIFSHAYLDENIDEIIKKEVDFAMYIQIYYPFRIQDQPDAYPGNDEKFCSMNYICRKAHGERAAELSQKKLHWWWTVNHVFKNLRILTKHEDYILFLNEDQIVIPDILHVLSLMKNLMIRHPKCEMMHLSSSQLAIKHFKDTVSIADFGCNKCNTGLAFNRTIFNDLKKFGHEFCFYNDYHWDHSLKYLSTRRRKGGITVLSVQGPRVLDLSGIKVNNREQTKNIFLSLHDFFKNVNHDLYPSQLEISKQNCKRHVLKAEGFWQDSRDYALCMFITNTNSDYRKYNSTLLVVL